MLRCIRCRWRRNVKALHQPALFLAILLATDTTALTSCDRRVHATVLQDLDQLAPERRNVLLDLVHIILGNALRFRLSLLYRYIPAHQIAHDALVPEVAFARLLHLPSNRLHVLLLDGLRVAAELPLHPLEDVEQRLGRRYDVERWWTRSTFLEVADPQLRACKLPLNIRSFRYQLI
uniref:Putative secreted protein n=1 Tax=Anopheles darlingi TaxID=43151 RepID=A0A2M4D4K5_ANODA